MDAERRYASAPPFFASAAGPCGAKPRHALQERVCTSVPAVSRKMVVMGAHASSAEAPQVRLGGRGRLCGKGLEGAGGKGGDQWTDSRERTRAHARADAPVVRPAEKGKGQRA